MRSVEGAALKVFQAVEVVVGVQFVESEAGSLGNGVGPPQAVRGAVVALLDAHGGRACPRVLPEEVFDSAEPVEAPVNISCVRIVAARRADERVIELRLRFRHVDDHTQPQVRIIGQVGRAVVVDQRRDPARRVGHTVRRAVVFSDLLFLTTCVFHYRRPNALSAYAITSSILAFSTTFFSSTN